LASTRKLEPVDVTRCLDVSRRISLDQLSGAVRPVGMVVVAETVDREGVATGAGGRVVADLEVVRRGIELASHIGRVLIGDDGAGVVLIQGDPVSVPDVLRWTISPCCGGWKQSTSRRPEGLDAVVIGRYSSSPRWRDRGSCPAHRHPGFRRLSSQPGQAPECRSRRQ